MIVDMVIIAVGDRRKSDGFEEDFEGVEGFAEGSSCFMQCWLVFTLLILLFIVLFNQGTQWYCNGPLKLMFLMIALVKGMIF